MNKIPCPRDGRMMPSVLEEIRQCPTCGFRWDGTKSFLNASADWTYGSEIVFSDLGLHSGIRGLDCSSQTGHVFVVLQGPGALVQWDPLTQEGTHLTHPLLDELSFADVAVGPDGVLYLAARSEKRVVLFDRRQQRVSSWDSGGSMNSPLGLFADSMGLIYVAEMADVGRSSLTVLGDRGCQELRLGDQGGGESSFKEPCSVALATASVFDELFSDEVRQFAAGGFMLVVDRVKQSVSCFTRKGDFLWSYPGTSGTQERGSWRPAYVARPPDDTYFAVTCRRNNEVVFLDALANFMQSMPVVDGAGRPVRPSALAFDARGRMYVGDGKSSRLLVYNRVRKKGGTEEASRTSRRDEDEVVGGAPDGKMER